MYIYYHMYYFLCIKYSDQYITETVELFIFMCQRPRTSVKRQQKIHFKDLGRYFWPLKFLSHLLLHNFLTILSSVKNVYDFVARVV